MSDLSISRERPDLGVRAVLREWKQLPIPVASNEEDIAFLHEFVDSILQEKPDAD